jgi:hypothetical protein
MSLPGPTTLTVRRRACAISNHEGRPVASSFETRFALLRMRVVTQQDQVADISKITGTETMTFEWSLTYFVIQVVAAFVGAHVAALVAHEHRFGFIGHSLVGVIAGAFSGFFLQRIVMTTITATGDAMPIAGLEAQIYQATSGLVSGGMAMLAVGFLRSEMTKSSGG